MREATSLNVGRDLGVARINNLPIKRKVAPDLASLLPCNIYSNQTGYTLKAGLQLHTTIVWYWSEEK